MQLSNRLNLISESETLAMTKKARALKQEGKDIISLSIGEPDFDTPKHIIDAAKKAMDEGQTHYPPVAGIPELRKAVVDKLLRENNLNYLPENVVVSTGAKHSIMNVVLSVINPGDEVLIPVPYWVSYAAMVDFAEGKNIFIPTSIENDFKPTAAEIEAAITAKTRMIIFSSPCNPSGSVYSLNELEQIAQVFKKYPQITIVSDEIYEHINYSGVHNSIASFEYLKNQVVVVNGVSKGYAMTGWRIGYIAAPLELALACEKIQGQFTSGANTIAQWASVAALNGAMEPTKEMARIFLKRRDVVLNKLREINQWKINVPEGAFYVFPDISECFGKKFNGQVINNAEEFCMFLLNESGVATVPGTAFGMSDYLRISFATSEDLLVKAIQRMKEAVDKLS